MNLLLPLRQLSQTLSPLLTGHAICPTLRRYFPTSFLVLVMCFPNLLCFAQVPPPQMSYYDFSFNGAFWNNEVTTTQCAFRSDSTNGIYTYGNLPTNRTGYSLSEITGKINVTLKWKSQRSPQPPTEPPPPYLIIKETCKVKIKAKTQGGTLDYAICGLPHAISASGTEDAGASIWQTSEATSYRLIDNPGSAPTYTLTPKGKAHAPAVVTPPGPTLANGCTVECTYSANAVYGILPVSGTNCKYTFPLATASPGNQVKVSCNGEQIYAATVQNGVALKTGCTYDSTHFQNNTLLTMKTEINGQTVNEDLLLVYNKFWIGNLNQVLSMPPFIPKTIKDMHHDPINALDDWEFSKPRLLLGSQYATLIYINVHGDPTHFSDIENFDASQNTTTSGEVNAIVQQRKIPPINVVYAYSCATCAGGSTAWANAFGIDADSVDRAYIGFDLVAKFFNGTNTSVAFWASLKKGDTVQKAMVIAQVAYNKGGNNGANLVLIGDPDTTLFKNVYKHPGAAWFALNQ